MHSSGSVLLVMPTVVMMIILLVVWTASQFGRSGASVTVTSDVTWMASPPLEDSHKNLASTHKAIRPPLHYISAMQPICTNPGPCRRCGGELEFRQTVERREKGNDVHFFKCKGCGHIDTRDNNERSAP